MPKESNKKPGEIPFVIKQAGKAWQDDIDPTLHALGQILFEDAWPAPSPKPGPQPRAEPETKKPKPLRLGAGYQITVVSEDGRERDARKRARRAAEASIPDAEIIEESTIPQICSTCGGTGKLGQVGHEIACPVCRR